MNDQEAKANDYANSLLERLSSAGSDGEIVAICKETEKAVAKLQTVHIARFHHIVNLVQLRRRTFAQAKEHKNKAQQDLWL